MKSDDADRQMLTALLALQNNFVDRAALVAAFDAWGQNRSQNLPELLVARGAITPEQHSLLRALAAHFVKRFDDDVQKSLAQLSIIPSSLHNELTRLLPPDAQASLAAVGRSSQGAVDDLHATRPLDPAGSAGRSRFRILRPHARGGLGEVFVAEDEELKREVALKQMQAKHADDVDSRTRFLQEAEITGGLEHPSIVPVYGLGTYADGRPFYAMRFIRGDSLQEATRRYHDPKRKIDDATRSIEFRKLLQRMIDVCNAVDYAHSRGVLHRDLKPGNIMLGRYGETLVVDWGLAKVVGRESSPTMPDDAERTLRPSLSGGSAETEYGSAVGTPAYMSPEQAEGKLDKLGPATDVYGLGATLYSVLTGKPPIDEPDVGEALRRVERGDVPPPETVRSDVPKPLSAICRKAMARKRDDRYASARELADDLERWLADEPVAAYRDRFSERWQRWGRRHRGVVRGAFVGLTAIAAAAGIAALLIARSRDEAVVARITAEESQRQALAAESRAVAAAEGEAAARREERKALDDKSAALERVQVQLAYNLFDQALGNWSEGDASRQATAMSKLVAAYRAAPRDHPLHDSIIRYFGDAVANWPVSWLKSGGSPETYFTPDGTRLVYSTFPSTALCIDDALTGKQIHMIDLGFNIGSMELSTSGALVAIGGTKGEVEVRETSTGKRLVRVWDQTAGIKRLSIDDDERAVCAASVDGTVCAWRIADGMALTPKLSHPGPVVGCWFEGKSDVIQTITDKDLIRRRWDVAAGKQIDAEAPLVSGPLNKGRWTSRADVVHEGSDTRVRIGDVSILLPRFRATRWTTQPETGRAIAWSDLQVHFVRREPTGKLAVTVRPFVNPIPFDSDINPDSGRFGAVMNTVAEGNLLFFVNDTMNEAVPRRFPASVSQLRIDSAGYRYLARGDRMYCGVVPQPESVIIRSLGRRADFLLPLEGDSSHSVYSNGRLSLVAPGAPTRDTPLPPSPPFDLVATGVDAAHVVTVESVDKKSVLRLWDVVARNRLATEVELEGVPLGLEMDAQGTCAVAVTAKSTAIYSVPELKLKAKLETKTRPAAWQSAGNKRRLALCAADGAVQVFDEKLDRPLLEVAAGGRTLDLMTFDPTEERLLLAARGEKSLEIRRITDGKSVKIELAAPLTAATFDPDGKRLVTADSQRALRVWNVETGAAIGEPVDAEHAVGHLKFEAGGKRFLTGGRDNTIKWWRLEPKLERAGEFKLYAQQQVQSFLDGETAERQLILTGGTVTDGLIFNQTDGLVSRQVGLRGPVRFCRWNRRAQAWIAAINEAGFFWVMPSDSEPVYFESNRSLHAGMLTAVAVSPDRRLAATGSADGIVQLHRPADSTPLGKPLHAATYVNLLSFSPDGRFLLASGGHGVRLWRVDAERGAHSIEPTVIGKNNAAGCAAWLPTGEFVYAGTSGELFRCHPEKPTEAGSLLKMYPQFYRFRVGPDGRYLAGMNGPGELVIYDLQRKRRHAGPINLDGNVGAIDFHPDGATLLVTLAVPTGRSLVVVDAGSGAKRGFPLRFSSIPRGGAEFRWQSADGRVVGGTKFGHAAEIRLDGLWADAPREALEASLDKLSKKGEASTVGQSIEWALSELTPEAEAALRDHHARRRAWYHEVQEAQRFINAATPTAPQGALPDATATPKPPATPKPTASPAPTPPTK